MLNSSATTQSSRQGIVLLVVMAMLVLFASVALSFVFYADAEATAARYSAQAQTQAQADVDPELLLTYFLGQLIYDTDDPSSSMRGQSLARNMYGSSVSQMNVIPFNGIGRLRYPVKNNVSNTSKNNNLLINYTDFSKGSIPFDSGFPAAPAAPPGAPARNPETDSNGSFAGGNVHWTYPDLNNMFLAAVNGSGEVLIPSFYRRWLGVNAANQNDQWAKYMTLRPHISYHHDKNNLPTFINPDWDTYGDVKNLEWGPGQRKGDGTYSNNDSIWMDLGFPVQTAPNGKRYKPLFAPLIVDMDGKLNLYVHGNIMGAPDPKAPDPSAPTHFSNQGFAWWEVNLSKLLTQNPAGVPAKGVPPESNKLFQGSPISRYPAPGNQPAGPAGNPLNNNIPAYYSKIDFGGTIGSVNVGGVTKYLFYPGDVNDKVYPYPNNRIKSFPDFPQFWDNAAGNDLLNHASGYNPFTAPPFAADKDGRIAIALSQIEALYRFGGTGSPAMTSGLFLNTGIPTNMTTAKMRWLSTILSMDVDRPGLLPYNWKDMTIAKGPPGPGQASDYNFPANGLIPSNGPPTTAGATFPMPPFGAEFDSSSMRSALYNNSASNYAPNPNVSSQLRVLLNKSLARYPSINTPYNLGDFATTIKADNDRTKMATDLYCMLIKLTGARDPNGPNGPDPNFLQNLQKLQQNLAQNVRTVAPPPGITASSEYQAARWLAQLAVNIVDFIDEDDYMTVFPWYTPPQQPGAPKTVEFVYGTELPQLLINEIYASVDNDPNDPAPQKVAKNYYVNFWIELHNPLSAIPGGLLPRYNGKVFLRTQPTAQGVPSQPIYQIAITDLTNFNANDLGNAGGEFSIQKINPIYGNIYSAENPQPPPPPPPQKPPPPSKTVTIITTSLNPPIVVGQKVSIGGVGVAGYNGTFTVTSAAQINLNNPPNKLPAPFNLSKPPNKLLPPFKWGQIFQYEAKKGNLGAWLPFDPPPPGQPPVPNVSAGDVLLETAAANGAPLVVTLGDIPGTTAQLVDNWPPRLDYVDVADPANPYAVKRDPDGSYRPKGFYVMGPKNAPPRNPNIPVTTIAGVGAATYQGLSWKLKAEQATLGKTYGVFLKRLANPNSLFDPNTNPYVTVDYYGAINFNPAAPVPLNDSRTRSDNGPNKPAAVIHSGGRKQPYVGSPAAWAAQTAVQPGQPQNTFLRHNGNAAQLNMIPPNPGGDPTLTLPFSWPVHLDRPLVNPIELLNVSCRRPWEYTQYFGNGTTATIAKAGATEAGATVTITTTAPHGFKAGQTVKINNVQIKKVPAIGYNGTFTIAAVNGPQSFTYTAAPGLKPAGDGTATVVNDHRSPWDEPNTLLYRLLESTRAYYYQLPPNGYNQSPLGVPITGKMNINSIWDQEPLDALVDNPNINIANLFKALLDSRSPQVSGAGVPGATPDIDFASDGVTTKAANMNRPFKSLNVGYYPAQAGSQYPNGQGMQDTILRGGVFSQSDGVPLLPPSYTNPPFNNVTAYPGGLSQKNNEVIAKIFNNITTRSNVFACWLTVGFFEVVDETVLPVKLGAEIGRAENRQVRHRMFAIIDRTNLITPNASGFAASVTGVGNPSTMSPANLPLAATGNVQVKLWVRPGMSITVDAANPKKTETVLVQSVDYGQNTFTANFAKRHAIGAPVILNVALPNNIPTTATPAPINGLLGNPGPQPGFDMRQNTLVVPHWSIIQ